MSRTKAHMQDGTFTDPLKVNDGSGYYGAVIDLTVKYGTFNEIQTAVGEEGRYFNDKFVDSPEKALAVACDVYGKRHVEDIADLINDVKFDPAEAEYHFVRFFTTNGHRPTEKQMTRWLNGDPEFRLYREEYAIQVYETALICRNLLPDAKKVEFPQKYSYVRMQKY